MFTAPASLASPAANRVGQASSSRGPLPEPEALHPTLWRASQLARSRDAALPTGYALLDAELPGGGWPVRSLTELLLPHPGVGEWRLLAPVLARIAHAGRTLMLIDPPATLHAPALEALGVPARQLVLVRARDRPSPSHGRPKMGLLPLGGTARSAQGAPTPSHGHPKMGLLPLGGTARSAQGAPTPSHGRARELLPAADMLWALEQALKSGHVGAVLAWLPAQVRADTLRRLQLAAQAHQGPAFVLRHSAVRQQPSPAPLRLMLSSGSAVGAGPGAEGVGMRNAAAAADRLLLHIVKRRGPAAVRPLCIELPPVLRGGRGAPARAAPPGEPARAAPASSAPAGAASLTAGATAGTALAPGVLASAAATGARGETLLEAVATSSEGSLG